MHKNSKKKLKIMNVYDCARICFLFLKLSLTFYCKNSLTREEPSHVCELKDELIIDISLDHMILIFPHFLFSSRTIQVKCEFQNLATSTEVMMF